MERATKRDKVFVVIDNSNIFIEGMKVYGESQTGRVGYADPRWRIRMDELLILVMRRRRAAADPSRQDLQHGLYLYGSIPSPSDNIWARFRNIIHVDLSYRSTWSGQEKEVDAKIVAKLATKVENLRSRAERGEPEALRRTVFVLVTGDGDMSSQVLNMVNPPSGLEAHQPSRVEIWSWRRSMSERYIRLASEYSDRVSLHYLDEYVDTVGFPQIRWRCDIGSMPIDRTLVIVNYRAHSEAIRRIWTQIPSASLSGSVIDGRDALAIISNVNMTPSLFEGLFTLIREIIGSSDDVICWTLWRSRERALRPTTEITYSNYYTPLTTQPAPLLPDENRQSRSMDMIRVRPVDEERWQTVAANGRPLPVTNHSSNHNRGPREWCAWRSFCQDGLNCERIHHESEKNIFRISNGKGRKPRKTAHCPQYAEYDFCTNFSCGFAHNEDELFCTVCERNGHSMRTCQFFRYYSRSGSLPN